MLLCYNSSVNVIRLHISPFKSPFMQSLGRRYYVRVRGDTAKQNSTKARILGL